MRLRDLLPLSYRALVLNKARSSLTMLGIIIGISSVILMISVGQSAQTYLLSQIASFGSDLVFIGNGQGDETRGGPPSSVPKQTLTERDLKKLNSLTWPAAISGSIIGSDLVSYQGEEKRTRISGASQDEIKVFAMSMQSGHFLEQNEIESRSRVAVLGQDVAKKLFGEEQPIGRTIKISRQPFRVIGILAPAGTRFFSNIDDQVYIPYTAFFDVYNKNRLNFIGIKSGTIRPAEAKELIRVALRETHSLDNPTGILSKDDFRVSTQEDTIKSANTIGTILQVLLGSIASISLFVAGIGIMNIMYVTVTERTREIGLRKAIGATSGDVLGQFLAEAIVLTSSGGLIGVLFGFGLSWIAITVINQFQSGWVLTIPWNGAALGFGVSAAIGIIFGFFPARRAAKLNPIEALRYE